MRFFTLYPLIIITTFSVISPCQVSFVNNAQKNLYETHDLITLRDDGLMHAITDFSKGNYSAALATAIGTREYAQHTNNWNISAQCQDTISFIIAYSCLESGSIQHGLNDLRKVCNKLIHPTLPILTSQDIEESLWKKIVSLSAEQTHLSPQLSSELLYYQHLNRSLAQRLFKASVNQKIIESDELKSFSVERLSTASESKKNNFRQLISLYLSYINAVNTKATQEQLTFLNKIKNHNDQVSGLRKMFIKIFTAQKNDICSSTPIVSCSTIHADFATLEKKNSREKFSIFLLSDGSYIKPLLKKLLVTQPYTTDCINCFLGHLYYHSNNYKNAYKYLNRISCLHNLSVHCTMFEAFNKSHEKKRFNTVLDSIKIIEIVVEQQNKITGNKEAQIQWSSLIALYVPEYTNILLQHDDLNNALKLAHLCVKKTTTYSVGLNLIKVICRHIKHNTVLNNTNAKNLIHTIFDSDAFKIVQNHQDMESRIITSWIKTEMILAEDQLPVIITEEKCKDIEQSLSTSEYTQKEKDLLFHLCGAFFYNKSNEVKIRKDQISYLDKAIRFNHPLAIMKKQSLLCKDAKPHEIKNFIEQLTPLANTPGTLQADALFALAFIYYKDKEGPSCVKTDNKTAFDYALESHELGNHLAAEIVGALYYRGIKNSQWVLEPDKKKACHYFKLYLKKDPTNPTVSYRLGVVYYMRGKKYYPKSLDVFNTIVSLCNASHTNNHDFSLKTSCLFSISLIELQRLDDPHFIAQALHHLEEVRVMNPSCILEDTYLNDELFLALKTYTNNVIDNNINDDISIQLCSLLGCASITSTNESRKNHAMRCLKYAADNHDLPAQLATFFYGNTLINPLKTILYLEDALDTINRTNPSDSRKNFIQCNLQLLYPRALHEKYAFVRYLTKNESFEQVNKYLTSDGFGFLYLNVEDILEMGDEYAKQCISDGILNEYVEQFKTQEYADISDIQIRTTLLYAYMLATSNQSDQLLKSASLLSKILSFNSYASSIVTQQLLSVVYYKLGRYHLFDNKQLSLAYFVKSADLDNIPCVIYLAERWLKNPRLLSSLTKQQIAIWIINIFNNKNILKTKETKNKIKSLMKPFNVQFKTV